MGNSISVYRISAYLRGIASDMEAASCEMTKLPPPWPVNACKLRGQASLIREWAEQVEDKNA